MRTRTVEQRLWNRVDRSDPEECWLWPRSTCQGYGRININGKMHQAHRVAWSLDSTRQEVSHA